MTADTQTEAAERPQIKRYFWRRLIAFLVDIFVVTMVCGAFVVLLDYVVPIKLVAPGNISFATCQERPDLIEINGLEEAFAGSNVRQILCERTHLFINHFNLVIIQKFEVQGQITTTQFINFVSDENGKRIPAIGSEGIILCCYPSLWLRG